CRQNLNHELTVSRSLRMSLLLFISPSSAFSSLSNSRIFSSFSRILFLRFLSLAWFSSTFDFRAANFAANSISFASVTVSRASAIFC
ncbi:unnamed protein product, partial [Oikopleura dioica]